MNAPEVRYAKSGDVSIAYGVVGNGPVDLVFIGGWPLGLLDRAWDGPAAEFFARYARSCRLILFDKRGTGMSDRIGIADLETRMDDVRAVMDAAGSPRAAIMGVSEGGPMTLLFAATYPERTAAAILLGTGPSFHRNSEFPELRTREEALAGIDRNEREGRWGTQAYADERLRVFAPGLIPHSDELKRWFALWMRSSASPGAAANLFRMNVEMDVRHVLPTIRVPTLVLHRRDELTFSLHGARYMADRIPNAELVELEGADHAFFVDPEQTGREVERFIAGIRERGEWDVPEPERVLATVLFTDIVNGTVKASELGDRGWRQLVEAHHAAVRRQLARYRGREVDTAGDGFYATFDGPARAVRCATAIRDALRPLGLEIRAGLHAGECEIIAGKTGGIATIIGARVREQAAPGEVLVSSTVKDLVAGSGLRFAERARTELKGVPGEWSLFSVEPELAPAG
ncbi:MAG TPA: adenylate/guanylate cyclase domain-containing protein [Candidatus Limnocylindria bacterium]